MSRLMQSMFRRFMDEEGGGEGGGGGGGGKPAPKPEPETFSKDYVRELRHENAGYRLKAQEAEKKAQDAEAAAKKAAEEADGKVKEANTAAEQRIIRAELKAAALKAGMVDLDGLKLADLSKIKLNEQGEVEGADELMEEMKKSKPYLFQSGSSTSSTEKPPKKDDPKPKKATEMSKEEYEAEKKRITSKR